MNPVRLVVTGGRDFFNMTVVERALRAVQQRIGPIGILIHGDAQGLDKTAAYAAVQLGLPVLAFPAKWNDVTAKGAVIGYRRGVPYNKLAGHWRNQHMIDQGKPTLGLVFPGGTGTEDMAQRLIAHNIAVFRIVE